MGQAFEHYEAHYRTGVELIRGRLDFNQPPGSRPDAVDIDALRRAVTCFERAAALEVGSWPAMWLLGKIHQRLGEHDRSLAWYARAFGVNPKHPDVCREACLAAMRLDRGAEALRYAEAAIAADPADAGLVANLALAHLVFGDLGIALARAEQAAAADPADEVTRNVLDLIRHVQSGKRARPRCHRDLPPD